MATPHVAGVVAAMMQINPALTPAQARDIVLDKDSYDWMTTTRAQSTSSGGRLNFNKVIHNPKLLSPGPLNNFPSITMGSDVFATPGGAVTVSSTSSDPDGDTLRSVNGKATTSAWLFGWMLDSLFPTPSANPSNFNAPSLARTATMPYLGATADNRGGGASAIATGRHSQRERNYCGRWRHYQLHVFRFRS
jgi:subtilisin family serine protease